MPPLTKGARIGILGGGQLGLMLTDAAHGLGFKTHIYVPPGDNPALKVADTATEATYDDLTALAAFAEAVDVITYEFENIPAAALDVLQQHKQVFPPRKALELTQDRLTEKQLVNDCGYKTAPFVPVKNQFDLGQAVRKLGLPAVLKTRRLGYDGKGQVMLKPGTDLSAALQLLGDVPLILEGFVDFTRELSIIAARGQKGDVQCFPLVENIHRDHILHKTIAPAPNTGGLQADAEEMADALLQRLDYVGVLAIELFQTRGNQLLVNELAPRVHNSGHWSIEGANCSQFEQHIRAITGLPLKDTALNGRSEMINLIGDEIGQAETLSTQANTFVHNYGKAESRPGRKMGHVTKVFKV